MQKKNILLFFSLLIYNTFFCNIFPKANEILYQTQVMFEIEEVENCTSYEIHLFEINESTSQLIKIYKTSSLGILSNNVLKFNNQYQWQYFGIYNNKIIKKSALFNFKIGACKRTNLDLFKTSVTKKNNDKNNDIIFIDKTAIAINREGFPVWFAPTNEDSLYIDNYRDVQLTPQGNVSFLNSNGAFVYSLNAKKLHSFINYYDTFAKVTQKFHHEFEVLNNNHFLVCYNYNSINQHLSNSVQEFDHNKNIIWQWLESNAIKKDSIFKILAKDNDGLHLNGFYCSKTNQDLIYLSFKNISQIILLDKKNDKILSFLNPLQKQNFNQQHGPFITASNNLLLYNNNINDEAEKEITYPEIQAYNFIDNLYTSKLIWKHVLKNDSFPKGIRGKEGYCMETKNGNILATIGGENFSIEINNKNKIIWECFFYKKNIKTLQWEKYSNYRTHYYSSLYPRYFTLQTKFSPLKNQLKINNDGTDDDVYEVLQKSKVLYKFKIKAGQTKIIKLKPNEKELIVKPKGIVGLEKNIKF